LTGSLLQNKVGEPGICLSDLYLCRYAVLLGAVAGVE